MKRIEQPTSPLEAIKQKCYFDCCAEDKDNYKNCEATTCALWQFRFGKNPYLKRALTSEQKAKMADVASSNREKKQNLKSHKADHRCSLNSKL